MTIGEKISQLRKIKGLTQAELAEHLGVTDKAVSKWERNLSCPDIATIPRLAEILDVSVEELLNAKEHKDSKTNNIIDIILKAVPLAMGIATIVTSVLKQIDIYSAFTILGIGLVCISIRSLLSR